MNRLIPIIVVAFCSILGATGQVFFKLGSENLKFNLTALITNWHLIVGLFCYAIATILFVSMLKHGKLSILYPVIALSYCWVVILSRIFLHEIFPSFKWIGISLIIIGVFIIQL
jgi:undecaprenyl phosphate-alpha-L-ara4N flippase subunit ArnE